MPQNDTKKILENARNHFVFSGAQIYAKRSANVIDLSIGDTSYWPGGKPVTPNTLFDIGSVTKVIATTSVLARLYDRGEVDLQAPLVSLSSTLKGTPFGELTLFQILTHTAGFLDWFPLYKEASPVNLIDWFKKSSGKVLISKPGQKVLYSDLGFLLMGEVLAQKFGKIEELFKKEVTLPLNLSQVVFGPTSGQEVVATEYETERATVLCGEVFDENARWMGGKAPHAGLFASARSLSPWCEAWLGALAGESKWLKRETAELFVRCHTQGDNSPRGIGFDLKSKERSSAGTLMGAATFGHLGYTGCSVWIDPVTKTSVVFLANRVHPSRVDERIRSLRPLVHDAVIQELEGA